MSTDMEDPEAAAGLLRLAAQLYESELMLVRSAPIMRRYASVYCGVNPSVLSGTCELYHGWWQYWRIVGLVATPNWHAEFYRNTFSSVPQYADVEVLICGSADYGALDHVVKCIPRGLLSRTKISIIDLCRTPLEICAWYAAEYEKTTGSSLDIFHFQRDALNTGFADQAFDLVTCYEFLERFADQERQRIVNEWHRILKPGGRIITTVFLGPSTRVGPTSRMEPEEFAEEAAQEIFDREHWLHSAEGAVRALALKFAETVVNHTVPSLEYITALFSSFECTIDLTPSVFDSSFQGPAPYARIMGIKRKKE